MYPDPALTADLVDGALSRAIGHLDAGRPSSQVAPATLAFVRRAVGIALKPPPATDNPVPDNPQGKE
jgi:hypothetical protein